MVSRKYAKDYSVEYRATPSGGLRGVAVYVGPYYRYVAGEPELRRAKRVLCAAAVLCWAAFVPALAVETTLARRIFVLLPHAACVLPLGLLSAALVRLMTLKPPLIREHGDSIPGRVSACSMIMLILSGAALLGAAISAAVLPAGTYGAGDWLYMALLAVFAASSAVIFLNRRSVKTEPAADGRDGQ